jgi:hypothetical protein
MVTKVHRMKGMFYVGGDLFNFLTNPARISA